MAENEPKNPPAGGQEPPAGGKEPGMRELSERITDLEARLAGKTEELHKAGIRLAELEKAAGEAGSRAELLAGGLKKAFAGYRALVLKANPDVPPDLISGESIEDLDGSLAKARELIGRIKAGLEKQKAAERVPAGAPPRGEPDTSGLSSREKISRGVEKARK